MAFDVPRLTGLPETSPYFDFNGNFYETAREVNIRINCMLFRIIETMLYSRRSSQVPTSYIVGIVQQSSKLFRIIIDSHEKGGLGTGDYFMWQNQRRIEE